MFKNDHPILIPLPNGVILLSDSMVQKCKSFPELLDFVLVLEMLSNYFKLRFLSKSIQEYFKLSSMASKTVIREYQDILRLKFLFTSSYSVEEGKNLVETAKKLVEVDEKLLEKARKNLKGGDPDDPFKKLGVLQRFRNFET